MKVKSIFHVLGLIAILAIAPPELHQSFRKSLLTRAGYSEEAD